MPVFVSKTCGALCFVKESAAAVCVRAAKGKRVSKLSKFFREQNSSVYLKFWHFHEILTVYFAIQSNNINAAAVAKDLKIV